MWRPYILESPPSIIAAAALVFAMTGCHDRIDDGLKKWPDLTELCGGLENMGELETCYAEIYNFIQKGKILQEIFPPSEDED